MLIARRRPLLMLLLMQLSVHSFPVGWTPRSCEEGGRSCSLPTEHCNPEIGRCDSVAGRSRGSSACFMECTSPKHGTCFEGVCHCHQPYYGIDCGKTLDSDGLPTLAYNGSYLPRRPLFWIYDISPEHFWIPRPNPDPFDPNPLRAPAWLEMDPRRPHLQLILERIVAAGHRTADPDEADYFLVPFQLKTHRHTFETVVRSLWTQWPYWNRGLGSNHIFVEVGDAGLCGWERKPPRDDGRPRARVQGLSVLFQYATVLQFYGHRGHDEQAGFVECHREALDLVIPPVTPALPVLASAPLRYVPGNPAEAAFRPSP